MFLVVIEAKNSDIMDDLSKRIRDLENRVKKIEEKVFISISDDVLIDEAKKIVAQYDFVSASMLQRRLTIGYSRAARLLDLLEQDALVSKAEGGKPRKVLK